MAKSHHKGKRICDICRHYFRKKDLKASKRGQFCKECYKKIHEIR